MSGLSLADAGVDAMSDQPSERTRLRVDRASRSSYRARIATDFTTDLQDLELLAGIDTTRVNDLARALGARSLEVGDVLYRQDDPADSFALVLRGALALESKEAGRTTWTGSAGAGALLGEIALLAGARRTATVTASEPTALAIGDLDAFVHLLDEATVSERIMRVASQRLAEHARPVPVTVKGGVNLVVRPLLPGDRDQLGRAIAGLSFRTRQLRFFTGASVPPHVIDRLTDLDYVNHFAWGAGLSANGPGVGVSRIIRDRTRPDTAEMAVAVVDDFQGTGLGTTLVGAAAVAAEVAGIEHFTASVLRENQAMRNMLDRVGATWWPIERGVMETIVPVADVVALIDPDLVARLRPVAEMTMAAALAPVSRRLAPKD